MTNDTPSPACSDCGQRHDPDIRCPNYHAGMFPTSPDPTDLELAKERVRTFAVGGKVEPLRSDLLKLLAHVKELESANAQKQRQIERMHWRSRYTR